MKISKLVPQGSVTHVMADPIDLDDQSGLMAVEVGDVPARRMLPAELEPAGP